MGIDSIGLINKNYSALDVLNYIKSDIDENAKLEPVINPQIHDERVSYIDFSYHGNKRSLFVLAGTYDYSSEIGVNEMHTLIKLSVWGEAEEVVEQIVEYFGGYFTPNDCNMKFQFFPFKNDIANHFNNEIFKLISREYKGKEQMEVFNFIVNNFDTIKKIEKNSWQNKNDMI